jgi:hypothetical protein
VVDHAALQVGGEVPRAGWISLHRPNLASVPAAAAAWLA